MPRVHWQGARRRQRGEAACGAPREVACRRPSFRYSATFPPVQARREGRVPAAPGQAGEQERCSRNSRPTSARGRAFRSISARALEQFLWLKLNLYRSRHISLSVWLNYGKEPPFILHRSGKTEIRAHPIIAAHADIGQCTPAGNELLTHLLVAKIELQSVAGAEPIV